MKSINKLFVNNEPVFASVAFQICWGLAYLHFAHIIHRDIKPSNILFSSTGKVALADFGISREITSAVAAQTFCGSFNYISPERVRGNEYNTKSDIWSFGIVCLEAVTGVNPYYGDRRQSNFDTIIKMLEDDIMPRRENWRYSDELYSFIASCLRKEASTRPKAEELLTSDFFQMHGIYSIEDARRNVDEWLSSRAESPRSHSSDESHP